MNTNFHPTLFGLTQPRIRPDFTISVAETLFNAPMIGFDRKMFGFLFDFQSGIASWSLHKRLLALITQYENGSYYSIEESIKQFGRYGDAYIQMA